MAKDLGDLLATQSAASEAATDEALARLDGGDEGDARISEGGMLMPSSTRRGMLDLIQAGLSQPSAIEEYDAAMAEEAAREEAPPEGVEPDSQERTAESDQEDPRVTKARAVLKLETDVPESVLDAMSPDELLRWSESAQTRKSKRDNSFRELREQLEGKQTVEDPDADARPGEPVATPQAPEHLDAIFRRFDELIDEEAGRAFRDYHAAIQAERQRDAQAFASLQGMVEEIVVSQERAKLTGEIPQLKSDERWPSVLERARKLAKTGDYGSIGDVLRESAMVEFARDMATQAADTEVARKQEQGRPTVGTRKAPTKRRLTPDEELDVLIEELERKHDISA